MLTIRFLRCAPRRSTASGLVLAALCLPGSNASAQIIEQPAANTAAVRYGQTIATRYRVGAKIVSKGGTVQDILAMVAVPLECPEQEVQVVEEEYSPQIGSVDFRTLPEIKLAEPGARQMLISIPTMPPRQEAFATITYEVLTRVVLPPAPGETAALHIPPKPDRTLKVFLSKSPFIDVNHRKIREACREALNAKPANDPPPSKGWEQPSTVAGGDRAQGVSPRAAARGGISNVESLQTSADVQPSESAAVEKPAPALTDWQRVEALYDYALEHVEYEEGPDKSAVQALNDQKGDCQSIAAVFVAMCRTEKVPARMVWVDAHQYAEFYLETETGNGHWYPVQSAGTRAFGEMPTPKVILQKGDNFRVPERRRERLRYASDYTLLFSAPEHKPRVTYVRETL